MCFYAAPSADGGMLGIPFTSRDEDNWLLRDKYDSVVRAYREQYASNYKPAQNEVIVATGKWEDRRKELVWDAILRTLAWIFFLVTAMYVIGWIVRGFAGIPSGQDQK